MKYLYTILLSLSLSSLLLSSLGVTTVLAQQPAITNIDPVNGTPNEVITIAGSGFGTNAANIIVYFGGVKGNVLTVTDNLIEVESPASAAHDNITVLNTSNGLSDTSDDKYFSSHNGESFNISQIDDPIDFIASPTQVYFDMCSCDFDNDGLTDIATGVSSGGLELKILKNTSSIGSVSFTEFNSSNFPGFNQGFTFRNINCADLNGDGNIDIMVSRNGQEKIFIYQNTNTTSGTMSFNLAPIEVNLVPFTVGDPVIPGRIKASDLTGDGKPELIITNDKEGTINVLINESAGNIAFNATQQIIDFPDMPNTAGIEIQDMDLDGRKDLILAPRFQSDLYVFRNIGAGGSISFDDPIIVNTSNTINVTTGDFDNDGLIDLVVNQIVGSGVDVIRNTSTSGSISFDTPVTVSSGSEPWIGQPGDINGDGFLDIVMSSRAETNYTVAINNGNFTFTSTTEGVTRNSRNVNISDYDGDGKQDIGLVSFSSSNGNAIQVLRNSNCHVPLILNETPLSICTGQTITLEAIDAPGATFTWSSGGSTLQTGPSNTLDITTSGTYDLLVESDGGGCSNSTSIVIDNGAGSVPGDPTADNNGPTCIGGDITLTVTGVTGATYSWEGPNGFSSTEQNPTITGVTTDNAGQYTVSLKVGDCQSSEVTTTVVVQEPPAFSVSTSDPTTVCQGSTVLLTTQNEAGYTYQWTRDGSNISGATNNTYSATESGIYSVEVSETAGSCQINTNEIEVIVYEQPVASFDITGSLCVGSQLTFTSTSSVDANATSSLSWDFGDGATTGSAGVENISYTDPGTYTVELTVSYSGATGCTASTSTQSITIATSETITITPSKNYICDGETVDLSIPTTFTNISWSTGETTSTITVSAPDIYSVTATDVNGCVVTQTFDLQLGAVPTITVTADGNPGPVTFTPGASIQLEANGADTYSWSPVDFLSDPNIANPVSTPTQEIVYTVTGSITDGCSSTAQIALTGAAEGEINITPLKAFSPNSTIDPTWRVTGVENYTECTMSIFDERGTVIFRTKGYANEWDGTYEGTPVPEGVYYFVFGCPDLKPKTGSILLVR